MENMPKGIIVFVVIIVVMLFIRLGYVAKLIVLRAIEKENNQKKKCNHTSWNYTTGKGRECNYCKSKI